MQTRRGKRKSACEAPSANVSPEVRLENALVELEAALGLGDDFAEARFADAKKRVEWARMARLFRSLMPEQLVAHWKRQGYSMVLKSIDIDRETRGDSYQDTISFQLDLMWVVPVIATFYFESYRTDACKWINIQVGSSTLFDSNRKSTSANLYGRIREALCVPNSVSNRQIRDAFIGLGKPCDQTVWLSTSAAFQSAFEHVPGDTLLAFRHWAESKIARRTGLLPDLLDIIAEHIGDL